MSTMLRPKRLMSIKSILKDPYSDQYMHGLTGSDDPNYLVTAMMYCYEKRHLNPVSVYEWVQSDMWRESDGMIHQCIVPAVWGYIDVG